MSDASQPPYLTVPNFFKKHQHYHRHESMAWVKLETGAMFDKRVRALSPNARLCWYEILQLAGYYMNAIPNDVDAIARECDRRRDRVASGVKDLLNAGLLREAIRKPKLDKDLSVRRVTGWRMVRGSHAISYVPDPRGTDRLPKFYTGAKT